MIEGKFECSSSLAMEALYCCLLMFEERNKTNNSRDMKYTKDLRTNKSKPKL
jgi:hypothetical protein